MRRARAFRRAAALALAALSVLGVASGAHARTVCVPDDRPGGDWPMMGHDYAHTRTQLAEHTIGRMQAPTLEPYWTFSANAATETGRNEITGYPIVADGCVFAGSSTGVDVDSEGYVFALNADGGDLVWKARLPHGVFSSVAVSGGVVYAYVSIIGSPTLYALDSQTGAVLWSVVVDRQPGADAVASPIVYDGMVWVGVSGTQAEGTGERFDFRGASVLVDVATHQILSHEWAIPDSEWDPPDGDPGEGDAGAAIWSTLAVDNDPLSPTYKKGFVGTGNPFNYNHESARSNAILKIDLDRASPTLGQVLGSYKGDVEQYFGPAADNQACERTAALFLAGFECQHLDLDFGAAPNLFTDRSGRRLVGAGQKSGVYHVFDPVTMQPVWKQIVGVPSPVGGIVGGPAFDGSSLYAPHSIAGYVAALDRDGGAPKWVSPTADAVHWGSPVSVANGVVYTADLKGFLDAYDAATGAPLLHRPMELGAKTGADPTFTWGGVSIARNTVYASVGVGLTSAGQGLPSMPDGFIIAFRPARIAL